MKDWKKSVLHDATASTTFKCDSSRFEVYWRSFHHRMAPKSRRGQRRVRLVRWVQIRCRFPGDSRHLDRGRPFASACPRTWPPWTGPILWWCWRRDSANSSVRYEVSSPGTRVALNRFSARSPSTNRRQCLHRRRSPRRHSLERRRISMTLAPRLEPHTRTARKQKERTWRQSERRGKSGRSPVAATDWGRGRGWPGHGPADTDPVRGWRADWTAESTHLFDQNKETPTGSATKIRFQLISRL